MNNLFHKGLRTWIQINTDAARHNIAAVRSLLAPNCKLMAVVKSNAYGHDLIEFSKLAVHEGVDEIAVDSITEAVALREAGIQIPILVLGYTLPDNFAIASEKYISITISSFENLRELVMQDIAVKIHLKFDTGMHRQGFFENDVDVIVEILGESPRIQLEGLYTHFAAAKNPGFPTDTIAQADVFNKICDKFYERGFKFIKHACASGGTFLFSQYHFDMVRVGAAMYGIWPSKETRRACEGRFQLQPVLSWHSIISEIKNISKGERAGYDFTETFYRDSKIAIVPIGYWHGFPRALSSAGHVEIAGQRARVLGRVSMDMIVVDITDILDAKVGDAATIIGDLITADEFAAMSDTTAYEILTRLNPLMRRIFT